MPSLLMCLALLPVNQGNMPSQLTSSRAMLTSGSEGQLAPDPAAMAATAASGGAASSVASVMSRAPQKYLIQNQSGLKVYYFSDGRVRSSSVAASETGLGVQSCLMGGVRVREWVPL